MNIRIIVVTVAIMATVAGCVVRSSGDPLPASTSTTTEPTYADLLPPRPDELDLTGVDPCADLFTEQQLRELRYDLGYARPPLEGTSDIHGGADCVYGSTGGSGGPGSNFRNMTALVGIATTEGALAWASPDRGVTTRPEVVTVAGYSALVLPHPKFPDNCLLVVDTAEGQYLSVDVSPNIGEADNDDPFCAEAERVAGMAIETVSASR